MQRSNARNWHLVYRAVEPGTEHDAERTRRRPPTEHNPSPTTAFMNREHGRYAARPDATVMERKNSNQHTCTSVVGSPIYERTHDTWNEKKKKALYYAFGAFEVGKQAGIGAATNKNNAFPPGPDANGLPTW